MAMRSTARAPSSELALWLDESSLVPWVGLSEVQLVGEDRCHGNVANRKGALL